MDTNSTAVFARVSSRAARNVAVIGVVSCLAVLGFAAAVTGAGPALSTQINIVSVDHTHKGDRLPLVPKHASKASAPVVTTLSRPPIGCESAFSAPLTRSVRTSLGAASPEFRTLRGDERPPDKQRYPQCSYCPRMIRLQWRC